MLNAAQASNRSIRLSVPLPVHAGAVLAGLALVLTQPVPVRAAPGERATMQLRTPPAARTCPPRWPYIVPLCFA